MRKTNKLYRQSNWIKTLFIEINNNVYELEKIYIMMDDGSTIKKYLYDVLDDGFIIDVDVKRRMKKDTGIKNNDAAFITKNNDNTWRSNTTYDLYIKNDLLDFRLEKRSLYNIGRSLGINDHYKSNKYDITFINYTPYKSDSMDQMQKYINKFYEHIDKKIFTTDDHDVIVKYSNDLINISKNINKYHEKSKNEILNILEKYNESSAV